MADRAEQRFIRKCSPALVAPPQEATVRQRRALTNGGDHEEICSDFELCADLAPVGLDCNRASAGSQTIRSVAGSRMHIRCDADFLPGSFLAILFRKFTINLGRTRSAAL
jgi:hypothetical protein